MNKRKSSSDADLSLKIQKAKVHMEEALAVARQLSSHDNDAEYIIDQIELALDALI